MGYFLAWLVLPVFADVINCTLLAVESIKIFEPHSVSGNTVLPVIYFLKTLARSYIHLSSNKSFIASAPSAICPIVLMLLPVISGMHFKYQGKGRHLAVKTPASHTGGGFISSSVS